MSYLTDLFKFRVESDASSSYLVLELKDGDNIQKLQLHMIEQNPSPLILPLSLRVKNSDSLIYYNVTTRISLKQFLLKNTLRKNVFIDIILSMIKVLTESKNYYANDKNFAIDEDLIYLNSTSYNVCMMYIPVDFDVDFKSVFKEFIKKIIDNLIQIEEVNELGFLQNMRMYLREDNFNLQEFQILLNNFKLGFNSSQKYEFHSGNVDNATIEDQQKAKKQDSLNQNLPIANKKEQNIQVPKRGPEVKSVSKNPVPEMPRYQKKETSDVETKLKYPQSSIIIGLGIQLLILVLISVLYIAVISKQEDKVGPMGGVLIIFGAVDFLVLRRLFDKNKKKSYIANKQKVVNKLVNPPVNQPSSVPANNNVNIPGAKQANPLVPPSQNKNKPKVANMNKRQIENQKEFNTPVPAFDTISPYDLGNTMILSQPDFNRTVILHSQEQTASLSRSLDGVTQKIEINSENFVIGRIPGQVDYILDNKNISKLHATIIRRDGKYYIKDQSTTNGTFINSKKIEDENEHEILNNDKIKLAALEFDFIISEIPIAAKQ